MSSNEKMQKIIERFDEVLDEQFSGWGHYEGCWYGRTLYALVRGDWKHAHMRIDRLLKETLEEFNCSVKSEKETEVGHSFGDHYESEHKYTFDLKNFKLPEVA